MKPQLAYRGAVQILKPGPMANYEEVKKPPMPMPLVIPPYKPRPTLDKRMYNNNIE